MTIQENIEKIWLNNTNKNINSIMFSYKTTNNIQTNDLSIVFNVDKKKSLDELNPNEIVPPTIKIANKEYKTDVVENISKVEALTCYTNYFGDPEILKLQGQPALLLPIKGGQEIVQFPTNWTPLNNGGYSIIVGTLGFFAIDNEDDRIVGVTNAHVLCKDFLSNIQRNLNSSFYNLYDQSIWNVDTKSYRPGALCRAGGGLFTMGDGLKRYSTLNKPGWGGADSTNYIDVCLIHLNTSAIPNEPSIFTPNNISVNTSYMPFATTSEIDNLLITNPFLYSSGRTTGPKGWGASSSCRLVVDSLFVSTNIWFDDSTRVQYSDIIRFRYQDSSNFPVAGGDSGSAVFAQINGVLKIVGLVFAGNGGSVTSPNSGTHYGFMCRIDRIASSMNIRSWTQSSNINSSQPSVALYYRPLNANNNQENFVIIDNQKYYNIGLSTSK